MGVSSGSNGKVIYNNNAPQGGNGKVYGSGSKHRHLFITDDNNYSHRNLGGGNLSMKSTPFEIIPPYYSLAFIIRVN
jgi:hypothetical protein